MSYTHALTQKYRDNPVRLMVLLLASKAVHPSDITSVTRVQAPLIRRWCTEDEIDLTTGVQPVGLRGLIERGHISTEQYHAFREATKGSDMASIVHLRPVETLTNEAESFDAESEPNLEIVHPGELSVTDTFSAENLAATFSTVDDAGQKLTEAQDGNIDVLKGQLSPKVFKYANNIFDGLNAMLTTIQDPNWLERQRANDLAVLFGVVSDRGSQLLGSLSSPGGEGSEEQNSRLPQRTAK